MDITITISDEKISEIVDAFVKVYNYPTNVNDENGKLISNPQTKKHFTLEILRQFIKDVHKSYNVEKVKSAKITARIDSDEFTNDIIIN